VIVVEHDRQMITSADYVVDLGPFAGRHGGEICFTGRPDEMQHCNSLTAQYLLHQKVIAVPRQRRDGNGKTLVLHGATGITSKMW